MTCGNCKFTRDTFLVSIDDLRDQHLVVTQALVKLRIDAQLSLLCPSCGMQVVETIVSRDLDMVPEWGL